MARPRPSDPLITVTVKVPESLLREVDRLAEETQVKRSDVVRDALGQKVRKAKR
jgi:metal-responsive CopG/Arc/MetJ family transcriptional regulator